MKKNLLLSLCCVFATPLAAQNCGTILQEAKAAYAGHQLQEAFRKLQDTETCDYRNDLLEERQTLQNQIFKAIDDQRMEAENNAKKIQESAQKMLALEKETQAAFRKAQAALDSLNIVLDKLKKANVYQVRLLLATATRNQQDLNFDAALERLETAKILRALPDSVDLAYQNLSQALLKHARESLQRGAYKGALTNIKSAEALNIRPDSVAAAKQALRQFLFENAQLDMVATDYDAAVEKTNAVHALGASRDTVEGLFYELAFCYTETNRLDRAAGLLDTLAQGRDNQTVQGLLRAAAGQAPAQKVSSLRQILQQLDPKRHGRATNRYLPPAAANIPGGTFSLGAAPADEAQGTCPVRVNPFWLGKKEVTFFEYDLFCAATNRPKPADHGWGRGERPVIEVDWYDAVAYCNWRSRLEDLQEVYVIDMESDAKVTCNWSAKGYRLPTEAEWEFAAGNGEKQTRFAWGNGDPTGQTGGNVSDEMAKTKFPDWKIFSGYTDGFAHTAPTGSFPPNDFGLYDMTGNVWEWCWDRYDENYCRANKNRDAPKGPAAGADPVLRGGSWGSYPADCFVGRRFHHKPDTRNVGIGFRVARQR